MNIADQLDRAMRAYIHPDGRKGISQPELSHASGVPQPTISRTLKGKSTPETKTLIKLAGALKCTLGGYTGTATNYLHHGDTVKPLKAKEPKPIPAPIDEIVRMAMMMTTAGQYVLLGRAQELAREYPRSKANPAE